MGLIGFFLTIRELHFFFFLSSLPLLCRISAAWNVVLCELLLTDLLWLFYNSWLSSLILIHFGVLIFDWRHVSITCFLFLIDLLHPGFFVCLCIIYLIDTCGNLIGRRWLRRTTVKDEVGRWRSSISLERWLQGAHGGWNGHAQCMFPHFPSAFYLVYWQYLQPDIYF